MTILVSACLLGTACRYDGRSKADAAVTALLARHTLIPVCGEIFGGLPTPRTPAERRGARVMTKDGRDVTDAYRRRGGGSAPCTALRRAGGDFEGAQPLLRQR